MKFRKKQNKNENTESRDDRFRRIASRRVQDILEKLRLLSNCSDKSNYAYDQDQIKKIFKAIDENIKIAKSKFTKSDSKENKFKL